MATKTLHPLGDEATGEVVEDVRRAVDKLDELASDLHKLDPMDPIAELDRVPLIVLTVELMEFLRDAKSMALFYLLSNQVPMIHADRHSVIVGTPAGLWFAWADDRTFDKRQKRIRRALRKTEWQPTMEHLGTAFDQDVWELAGQDAEAQP